MRNPVTKKMASKKTSARGAQEPMSVAERVSNSRERLIKEGGRVISTLVLKQDAAAALAILEAEGKSATKIISELLIGAAKRRR